MRVHWVSLLPPVEIATARLAVQALHALSEVAEVAVWAAQEPWDPALAALGTVRPLGPDLWRETNRGEPLIAFVGEEPENAVVLQVARHHVDVTVLHGRRFDRPLRLLEGERWAGGDGAGEVGDAVASARAAAGHGPEILCHLEGILPEAMHPGRVVEQPPPFAPNTPWRAADGGSTHPAAVLVRQGRVDLLTALLGLVSALPGPRLELVVAGGRPPGLAEELACLGRWEPEPFHRLVDQLDRFDLAVLLDTGDAPCVDQLALWSRSAPTIAPAAGWHRDQPVGTYVALRPGHEREDLETHLRHRWLFPGELRALGAVGRRHLESRHAPTVWRDRVLAMAARGLQAGPAMSLRPLLHGLERELESWKTPVAALELGGRVRPHVDLLTMAASNDHHQELDR